jgi:diguanylate cyclase (GGDEF)-like protein
MYESALRDGLTKLFNKKYFLDRLEGEFAFAVRHHAPLSLVLFDIDHFKEVNDTHGHLAGDHALQTLAQAVSENTRQEDVFARYGGEEFAIICRGVDLEGATVFGERIRGCVERATLVHNGVTIRMTVSVGVAAVGEGMRQSFELITQADEALYQAKRTGRNRVVTATDAGKQVSVKR